MDKLQVNIQTESKAGLWKYEVSYSTHGLMISSSTFIYASERIAIEAAARAAQCVLKDNPRSGGGGKYKFTITEDGWDGEFPI